MKKTRKKTVIFTLIIFALCTVVVFAVFFIKTVINTNIKNLAFDINSTDFTATAKTPLTFTTPGDKKDIEIKLNNNAVSPDGVPLQYYFGIKLEGGTSGLESALLVSYNGQFLGTLSGLCSGTNEYLIKPEAFILPKEQGLINTLSIELHNAASYYLNKTAKISINLYTKTVDVQKYVFVKNDYQFEQAVTQINANKPAERTIVLADNVALTKNYDINVPCTIDLLGKQISFSDKKINLSATGLTTIKSSRTLAPPTASAGGFVLNNATGYLNVLPNAKNISSKVSVTNCSKAQAFTLITNRITQTTKNGVPVTPATDVLQGLDFYLPTQITLTPQAEYTLDKGTITPSVTPKSIPTFITIATTDTPPTLKKLEFGITAVGELNDILTTDLKHLVDKSTIGYDLFLPTKLKNRGATIEWWSSDQTIITNNGKCVGDGTVQLIATIKVNNNVYTHEYTFTTSKMNNAKRFQYLLDRIGNVKLTNVGVANGVVLPTESTYKTLYNPSIPDLGIAKITYTIDTRYNYISFDSTSHKVYLNKLTFEQYAQVKISVKFANEEKLYDGIISVDIIQGDSSATEAEIIAQVQKLVDKIDVWQNILTSRATDVKLESGDFSLPTSLSGKTITYAINPLAPECAVNNNTGKFTISLDKLKPTAQVITIKVTVGATIKDMTFTLPSAIHQDVTGFVNQNAFTSTRKQVYNQAYKGNSNVQDGKNWIFINDIKKCKTLTYSANDVLTDCKGIDYFTELTSFTTTSPTSQNAINRLAGLKKLTTISAENAGIIDIFPICSLPLLTSLDVSGNGGLKNLNPILSLDLTKLTMFDARGATIDTTHFTPLFDYCYNVYDNANADTPKYPSYYLGAINASVYSPAQLTNANYVSAMKYIYSVPDILELKTKYIQLPTRIMTGANSSTPITWASGDTNIARIRSTTGQEIKRLQAYKSGETYVKATVTVNGVSFTRYFYFKVTI